MIARQDLLVLHEPLEGLVYLGPIEVAGRRFDEPDLFLDWLLTAAHAPGVFLKETVNRPVLDLVLARPRFLAEARHAFLIRSPEEIAISWYALEGDMRIHETGVQALHELFEAVERVGSHSPIVVDADDLISRPEPAMRAYCEAVGVPYLAHALQWEAGVRPEWARTARWHTDVSASTSFAPRHHADRAHLALHPDVRRFVARHQPYHELLRTHRLAV